MHSRRALRFLLSILIPLVLLAGGAAWIIHAQLQREALRLPLIEAVIHQDSKEVMELLERGADPNARSYPPATIHFRDLWRRFWRRKPQELISPYPTALMLASQLGDLVSMKSLLDHGADLNARINDGRTALLVAIDFRQIKAARLLVDRGIDVNARDMNGETALLRQMKNKDLLDDLLDHGADVTICPHNFGWSALTMAAQSGDADTIMAPRI